MLKNLTLDALEEHPDLNPQTPKEFVNSILLAFGDRISHKTMNKYLKNAGKDPITQPRKSYANYKFSEATIQKRKARQDKIAQRRALRDEYMGIDMTDPKAGRAKKRAFNLDHGRYKLGRKAARTTRDWPTWDAARKAYRRRKNMT